IAADGGIAGEAVAGDAVGGDADENVRAEQQVVDENITAGVGVVGDQILRFTVKGDVTGVRADGKRGEGAESVWTQGRQGRETDGNQFSRAGRNIVDKRIVTAVDVVRHQPRVVGLESDEMAIGAERG